MERISVASLVDYLCHQLACACPRDIPTLIADEIVSVRERSSSGTMQRRGLVPVILAICLLGQLAESRFVIEQGGLKITFPQTAARAHPKGFDMSLANFGSPKYGGSLM